VVELGRDRPWLFQIASSHMGNNEQWDGKSGFWRCDGLYVAVNLV
jgi:hypothetical protein